jgi:hypothetical protein
MFADFFFSLTLAILKVRSIASVKEKKKSANILETGSYESSIEREMPEA